ncbi:mediator of RNA polymerase II transcription subunit 15a-like isoform X2 [Vicia villosa]|uniref:mediator of RNA polymerase II transcription subunit 15a-like isoform X2 n=1 Tax=Vicia villosa TaxID=3911 RepID=UPI00273AD6B7|nr:mediator of RNA polymerase II transcription subunit 15a-like isoform X2 [Vicia villosa]
MPRSFVATTFDTPSMRKGFNQFTYIAESDLNSFTTKGKRSLTVENHNLLAEIKDINNRLFDCEVVIAEKENAKNAVGLATDPSEGLVVKILYNAVTINQNLVSHFTADKKSLIEPLRLLIPSSYPSCSLVILDELPLKVSDDLRALSERAKEKLRFNLCRMEEPLLIKDIARVWERCAREAILDYAHVNGGGTFSSMQGGWEVY